MRFVVRTCAVVALALLIAGCQTVSHGLAAATGVTPPRRTVAIEDSQFEPTITIRGTEQRFNGSAFNDLFLRSWVAKSDGEVSHQIYVLDHYSGDWKFWSRANSQDATPLEFTQISRDVGSCSAGCDFWESFGVTVADSTLRSHRTGYAVKVYARSGDSMVLTVTGDQIAAQLAAVDSLAARVRASHTGRP